MSTTAFAKLAFGDRSDGIVAIFRPRALTLADLVLPDAPLIVVLEAVEKPGNLGAVLRSADGAGADAVVVADPATDLTNPNVIRASAGTIFAVPTASATSDATTDWLHEHGIRILAATVGGAVDYVDVDMTGPVALVLGSEADGLSDCLADGGGHADRPADARDRRQPERVGDRGRPVIRSPPTTRPSRDAGRLTG